MKQAATSKLAWRELFLDIGLGWQVIPNEGLWTYMEVNKPKDLKCQSS